MLYRTNCKRTSGKNIAKNQRTQPVPQGLFGFYKTISMECTAGRLAEDSRTKQFDMMGDCHSTSSQFRYQRSTPIPSRTSRLYMYTCTCTPFSSLGLCGCLVQASYGLCSRSHHLSHASPPFRSHFYA